MLKISPYDYIPIDMIKMITNLKSESVKKIAKERKEKRAEDSCAWIDLTKRRKMRSLIILVDGTVVATAVTPETLYVRFQAACAVRKSNTKIL